MKQLINSFLTLSLLFIFFSFCNAQFQIHGHITDAEGKKLTDVQIGIPSLGLGAYTDSSGYYSILLEEEGEEVVSVFALGYKNQQQKIQLKSVQPSVSINWILEENMLGLNEVVVTATLKNSFASQSPVKIDVYKSELFQQNTSPSNLMEALTLINGVQEQTACGVCYTNSISINGLPGPYTAVLIDGTPMYGNLASVYGLNGIATTMIDRIEVIKGPSSTLYGSEAMGGVINIITKTPENEPLLSLDWMGSSHLESFSNLSWSAKLGKISSLIGLHHAFANNFEDFNQDGFGDRLHLDRVALFGKWKLDRKDNKKTTLFAKYYYEDRRNGVSDYLKNRAYQTLRGDDEIYGESIYTQRYELMGTHEFNNALPLRMDFSFSSHHQDSYYGADHYFATQYIGFLNSMYNHQWKKHDLLTGLSLRYQYYNDNTVATALQNTPKNQWIPGLWLQDEWNLIQNKLTLLSGMRLDYYSTHGLIPAPRFSIKYQPNSWWTLRMNLGSGFRVVNLFTEDHAFVSGNRRLVIEEPLNPEQSYSGNFNLNYVYAAVGGQGTIDIDAFYTFFNNAIFPDYSNPDLIIYKNLTGNAQSRGIAFSINHQFQFPLSLNLSGTLMESFELFKENNSGKVEKTAILFAPIFSGNSSLNYELKKYGLKLAYNLSLTGPMQLPEIYDLNSNGQPSNQHRPTSSKTFTIHNLQISKEFSKLNLILYSGIRNIFNYRQSLPPLSGYNDPNSAIGFSDYFDTSYAYSPIHGREFYLGLRWNIRPKS